MTPLLTTTEEESHLDAGVSSELDGGVVVAGAEEVVDQHAVETSLAPLRAHHRHLTIILLQVIDAALANLRRIYLLLNVLLRLRHTNNPSISWYSCTCKLVIFNLTTTTNTILWPLYSTRTEDFVQTTFYCPHALPDSNNPTEGVRQVFKKHNFKFVYMYGYQTLKTCYKQTNTKQSDKNSKIVPMPIFDAGLRVSLIGRLTANTGKPLMS